MPKPDALALEPRRLRLETHSKQEQKTEFALIDFSGTDSQTGGALGPLSSQDPLGPTCRLAGIFQSRRNPKKSRIPTEMKMASQSFSHHFVNALQARTEKQKKNRFQIGCRFVLDRFPLLRFTSRLVPEAGPVFERCELQLACARVFCSCFSCLFT